MRKNKRWLLPLLSLSLVAAACGSDDDDDGTETSGSAATTEAGGSGGPSDSSTPATDVPADMDPDGILRYAYFFGPITHFDPIQSNQGTDAARSHLVFGTLMREQPDGSTKPWMAESVEVVDPKTVKITLREGVTFTDGTPYDAEAVSSGLMRTRTESASADVEAAMNTAMKSLVSVDVVDPLTVRANLDQPLAGEFITALAGNSGIIVSPKQVAESPAEVDRAPIGAGPYMLTENIDEQLLSFRKNPDFWDADSWKLAGIDFVATPTGAPMVTGLLGDAIDLAVNVSIENLDRIEAEPGFAATAIASFSFDVLYLCTTKAPLDNEKVRQAIQVGIDRDEYNELVYQGRSEPAYGFFREGQANYNPDLEEVVKFDPEEAKRLLKEAGAEGVTVDVYWIIPINYQKPAEVIQAQLKEVGINVNLIASGPDDLFTKFIGAKAPGALFVPTYGAATGVEFFSRQFSKGGQVAFCDSERKDVMDVVSVAGGMNQDDPAAIEAFKEAQAIVAQHAYTIPVAFQPRGMAWNTDRIGGTPQTTGNGGDVMYDSIYIKK